MPYIPTNPVLPDDPGARRRIYLNHRRILMQQAEHCRRQANLGFVACGLVLLVALAILVIRAGLQQ